MFFAPMNDDRSYIYDVTVSSIYHWLYETKQYVKVLPLQGVQTIKE